MAKQIANEIITNPLNEDEFEEMPRVQSRNSKRALQSSPAPRTGAVLDG